jgi:hypothetical protein
MGINEIRKGDIGTVFERTVYTIIDGVKTIVNVSSATTMEFIFTKPDGTKMTKDADFSSDGSDGKLRYVTVADDLDGVGDWKLQVYVILSSGEWHSDISHFRVHDNL